MANPTHQVPRSHSQPFWRCLQFSPYKVPLLKLPRYPTHTWLPWTAPPRTLFLFVKLGTQHRHGTPSGSMQGRAERRTLTCVMACSACWEARTCGTVCPGNSPECGPIDTVRAPLAFPCQDASCRPPNHAITRPARKCIFQGGVS